MLGWLKIVLAKSLSLFKSTKPYLGSLGLISLAFNKNPDNYALTFLTLKFMFFAKNMIKLIAKYVKAGASRKFMERIGNKLNMSQIWLRGFELATYHHSNH